MQNQFQQDISFVRRAIERVSATPFIASVPLLWAGIIAVGFGLNDFNRPIAAWFWMIAIPLGFLASAFLAKLFQRTASRKYRQ